MGFLKDMSDSAVNFPEYRNIAHSPWKKVITYLLLIVLILGLPVLLSFAFDFNRGVDLFVSEFHKKVPDFVLKNGELTMSGKMPLVFESDGSVVYIDISGETDDSVLDNYDLGIYFSKTEMVSKQSTVEKQTFSYSVFQEQEIHKADVENYLSESKKFVGLMIIFFGLIYFFLAKLCTTALLGFICLLFSSMQNSNLRYGQAFKITVFALTIPTLFQALHQILAPGFVYGWSIYYTIALLYLWFAVRANRSEIVEQDGDLLK